ncbi:MAG: carbon starvation protein A [Planctomycetota bacterium]|nr:MAG: carbon starvation protein A [Planctomycetota bacterium]
MSLVTIVVAAALCLLAAYRFYGWFLAAALRLDPDAVTPAVALRDDNDYVPIEPRFLLGQHFSAIAAAGPIVGPILAGVMFGWLPALLWIVIGSIFIGGVHDITALVASVRHKARSIAEVVREHMSRRSYVLFLAFVWFALVYIVVAFTDITASSFIGSIELESGEQVSGGGIATSSLLYLLLPVIMGLLLRFTRLPLPFATVIFLPLVGVAIWAGQLLPLDFSAILKMSPAAAQRLWGVLLLIYCFVASMVPMWLLLQPRGHLGGYFLYFALVGGALGLVLGGEKIQYPAYTGWTTPKGETLFPMLFILIACGACSGFHSIVASGTTCKQLRRETDAKIIGYGAMLMEGMVAVVSLCCVMRLAPDAPLLAGQGGPRPNYLYASGIGSFLGVLGIPAAFGVSFGLMAFTTFVYDTLDVCTRLGRYVLEELFSWRGRAGRVASTALTAGVPLYFLMGQPTDPGGRIVPVWRVFWDLFGASNQLLAALTLIGVTVWLWQTRRARWVWLVTGLPMIWMYVMSTWALMRIIGAQWSAHGLSADPVPWVGVTLLALAALMLIEAVRLLFGRETLPPPREAVPAT